MSKNECKYKYTYKETKITQKIAVCAPSHNSATPPWLLKRPRIKYNIHCSSKGNTSLEIYRKKFFEFCDHYKDFSQLYTDGSKMGNQVAAAVVHGNVTKATRLPIIASIFSRSTCYFTCTLSHSP